MSTSTTVWYNDYTIYNELLRLSRLHKFNQFTFKYLMKYAVKGSQVILDEIELLNSAEVEDDEKELITKKMLIVLKSYKYQCHDAASLCSLAPSPQGLTNDDEVGVQSADGVSDSRVRVQLPANRRTNEFDRSFPSVDDERSIKIKQKYIPGLEQLATYIEAFQFPAFVSTYLQICAGTGNLINSSKIESLQKSELKNDEKKEIAYSLMVDLLLAKNLD